MKSGYQQKLGHLGESIAADYLEKNGYRILHKNFRTPYGEIDVICQSGETIVFVEVKTRSSSSLGPPEISITAKKQEHMRSAAEYFAQQYPELCNEYRIDVITVQKRSRGVQPDIDHFENAIS